MAPTDNGIKNNYQITLDLVHDCPRKNDSKEFCHHCSCRFTIDEFLNDKVNNMWDDNNWPGSAVANPDEKVIDDNEINFFVTFPC